MLGITLFIVYLAILCANKIVKNERGDYFYLSFTHKPTARPIPDDATVESLGFAPQSIRTFSDAYLSGFEQLPEMKSLQSKKSWLRSQRPKDMVHEKITKILILAHPYYILNSVKFERTLNPSIEAVGDAILMGYRERILDDPINLAWLSRNLSKLPAAHSKYGIGNFLTPDIRKYGINDIQEDPRLMRVGDDLFLQYTAIPRRHAGFNQGLCRVPALTSRSSASGDFCESYIIDGYDRKTLPNGKNWVMFSHPKHRLLFMENINPVHVVEPVDFGLASGHNLTVRTVVYSKETVKLPWLDEYGTLIRGSTPGIQLPSVNGSAPLYLAFFHTVVKFQQPTHIRTYFMGAMTFCGNEPFNIHSMSARPIVPDMSFYTGPYVQPRLDYVLFPIGLVLLDKDTLLLSLGHQDQTGYILRLSLSGLLASLAHVAECRNH